MAVFPTMLKYSTGKDGSATVEKMAIHLEPNRSAVTVRTHSESTKNCESLTCSAV